MAKFVKTLFVGIFIIGCLLASTTLGLAQTKKIKVMYKAHTQFDFSGNQVSGKIRTPAVFYIFQRKRSEGHQVIVPPVNFNYHDTITEEKLKRAIGL